MPRLDKPTPGSTPRPPGVRTLRVHGPTGPAFGVIVLILLHLLAGLASELRPSFLDVARMQPEAFLFQGQLWRPLTGIFFSDDHLGAVAWLIGILALLGPALEREDGTLNFVSFYVAAGV